MDGGRTFERQKNRGGAHNARGDLAAKSTADLNVQTPGPIVAYTDLWVRALSVNLRSTRLFRRVNMPRFKNDYLVPNTQYSSSTTSIYIHYSTCVQDQEETL